MAAEQAAIAAELAASRRWIAEINHDIRVGEIQRRFSEANAALESQGHALNGLHHRLAVFIQHATSRIGRIALELARSAEQRDDEIRKGLGSARKGRGPEAPSALGFAVGDNAFDSFYADFESQFRGSRADIHERQSVYLEYLKTDEESLLGKPVLDIGCGRGEWLELLAEHGLKAVGVDINQFFCDDNQRYGLTVVQQDGLAFLKAQPDNSARAITGFHIIEHLEFPTVIELLDETLRVLAPGGLAIFETPNPENLITAAHKFYLDPTRRHPIPPTLAGYLLSHRGFKEVEILRLHDEEAPREADFDSKYLRSLFFGPRDYGLIGRK
jgi:O-antigen chain-terminating methyltransferase